MCHPKPVRDGSKCPERHVPLSSQLNSHRRYTIERKTSDKDRSVTDAELLAKMRNFEDHLVERKTASDDKDWLKTIVAFANSTPQGSESILYIGVRNTGEIEPNQHELDSLQKGLNFDLKKAYPPIECIQRVISENGRQALAVIVPHSKNRPHFSGPAYIRRGSETVVASEEQFNHLIASRNSKVALILQHKGEPAYIENSLRTSMGNSLSYWGGNPRVIDCNEHFVTIATGTNEQDVQTFPMSQIDVGFDYKGTRRLKLTIHR